MHFHGKKKKFIELVERIMVRWGYTNTEGRIYGILLISEKPLTIKDLLKLTDLSRTSISTSLKRLARDELVNVKREKKIKYFTPNTLFTDKFMKQPKDLLNKEIVPLLTIVNELSKNASSEEYREKLLKLQEDLKNLEILLNTIIRLEENKLNKNMEQY